MSDAVVTRPAVAAPPRRTSTPVIVATFGMVGLIVFVWLSSARAAGLEDDTRLPPLASASVNSPTAEVLRVQLQPASAAPNPSEMPIPISQTVPSIASPPTRQTGFEPAFKVPSPLPSEAVRDAVHAPALIVDLAQNDTARVPGATEVRVDSGGPASARVVASVTGPATDQTLNDTERFSARVGEEEVEVATARQMTGLDRMVPQGAVIGAVMETALNSDLPGYARAIIQRDVRSFDGSAIMIPAGSRVIGQYKSGVAQGASRVFVLWTRLIRPDGVTIDLASPATDDLGRAGIWGKVNRHFIQRFGSAILTTVLSAGLNAGLSRRSGGSTIVVGSASEATSLASQAGGNSDIPPTITTRQGAAVRIFVTRDLDFSRVGPAK